MEKRYQLLSSTNGESLFQGFLQSLNLLIVKFFTDFATKPDFFHHDLPLNLNYGSFITLHGKKSRKLYFKVRKIRKLGLKTIKINHFLRNAKNIPIPITTITKPMIIISLIRKIAL